jgi:hypothetical protein
VQSKCSKLACGRISGSASKGNTRLESAVDKRGFMGHKENTTGEFMGSSFVLIVLLWLIYRCG